MRALTNTPIAVTDLGGSGPTVVLLHGLAGSSRELLPTAAALRDDFRVLLVDQRGHGMSARRPADLSRAAMVGDVVGVLDTYAPGERAILVGQSMGAHTAFLTAASHPHRVAGLVMLEGHAMGNDDPGEAARVGEYFASWPTVFSDVDDARAYLGDGAIADAWVADLELTPTGLSPRFDADIMQKILEAVHVPRWPEWETLDVPTLAVFAKNGMFSDADEDELIRRRPATERVDLASGSHDAHLDALGEWTAALRGWLTGDALNLDAPPAGAERAPVITLCGSTRFGAEFADINQRLTLDGYVVISLGMFGLPDGAGEGRAADPAQLRARLRDIHFQKIRMADEVYIVDPGGYVGDSTRREIAYATALGKRVRYLSRE